MARGAGRRDPDVADGLADAAGNVAVSRPVALRALDRRVLPGELRTVAFACENPGAANFAASIEWQVAQLLPSWPRWTSLWQVAHVDREAAVASARRPALPMMPVFATALAAVALGAGDARRAGRRRTPGCAGG